MRTRLQWAKLAPSLPTLVSFTFTFSFLHLLHEKLFRSVGDVDEYSWQGRNFIRDIQRHILKGCSSNSVTEQLLWQKLDHLKNFQKPYKFLRWKRELSHWIDPQSQSEFHTLSKVAKKRTNWFFEDLLSEAWVIISQGVFILIRSFLCVCWISRKPKLNSQLVAQQVAQQFVTSPPPLKKAVGKRPFKKLRWGSKKWFNIILYFALLQWMSSSPLQHKRSYLNIPRGWLTQNIWRMLEFLEGWGCKCKNVCGKVIDIFWSNEVK